MGTGHQSGLQREREEGEGDEKRQTRVVWCSTCFLMHKANGSSFCGMYGRSGPLEDESCGGWRLSSFSLFFLALPPGSYICGASACSVRTGVSLRLSRLSLSASFSSCCLLPRLKSFLVSALSTVVSSSASSMLVVIGVLPSSFSLSFCPSELQPLSSALPLKMFPQLLWF